MVPVKLNASRSPAERTFVGEVLIPPLTTVFWTGVLAVDFRLNVELRIDVPLAAAVVPVQ